MAEHTIVDFDGASIEVGTIVRLWDYTSKHSEWGQWDKYVGIVTDLGEWDGDVDSEGRNIGIAPRVTVKFFNGAIESFPTTEWAMAQRWMDDLPDRGEVEEIVSLTLTRPAK